MAPQAAHIRVAVAPPEDIAGLISRLNRLEDVVREFGWLLYAYCLMGNHFHLVLETPQANISAGMQRLKGDYANWFNPFHPNREGVLFERRFWSRIADQESYVYELSRYVVLNPVRAGFVRSPEQWRWSSYAATVGLERCPAFLCFEPGCGEQRRDSAARTRCHTTGTGDESQ